MQTRAPKYRITSFFHILSLIFLGLTISACDGKKDVTMIPAGDNPGNQKTCGDNLQCKAARDSRADKFSKIALHAGSWAEMLIFAAHGEQGKAVYWDCALPVVSTVSGNETLSFTKTGDECEDKNQYREHELTIANLVATISRDSDNNIEKIEVKPATAFVVETKSTSYGIDTTLNVGKLEINRLQDGVFKFEAELELIAEKEPNSSAIGFSGSTFKTESFITEGQVQVEEGFQTAKMKLSQLNMKSKAETKKKKATNYSSVLEINQEDDSAFLNTACGITQGKLKFKNSIETKEVKPGSSYGNKVGNQGLLQLSTAQLRNILTRNTELLVTCGNDDYGLLRDRLFTLVDHIDMMFADMHGAVGNDKNQNRGSSTSGSQNGVIPTSGNMAEMCKKAKENGQTVSRTRNCGRL